MGGLEGMSTMEKKSLSNLLEISQSDFEGGLVGISMKNDYFLISNNMREKYQILREGWWEFA